MSVLDVLPLPQRKIFKGEVGIEVEVEGSNLPDIRGDWKTTTDGSLRGEAYEYIFKCPLPRDKVTRALDQLNEGLAHSTVNMNDRTSVHVHVNVQQMSLIELFCFIILYLVYEDVLFKYCGDNREGNLFCLRGKDAEYVIDILEHISVTGEYDMFGDEGLRYSGINLNALTKFGSLEFRGMRGTVDTEVIQTWTDILLRMKDMSSTLHDPQEIISSLSTEGYLEFTTKVFGEEFTSLLCSYPQWQDDIREGYRRVQRCVYSCNWDMHRGGHNKPRYNPREDAPEAAEEPMFSQEDIRRATRPSRGPQGDLDRQIERAASRLRLSDDNAITFAAGTTFSSSTASSPSSSWAYVTTDNERSS